MVEPPYAPAKMPAKVMPICTVDRNSAGSSAYRRAAAAAFLPSSAACLRRALRDETMAISAMAKKPFTRISAMTTKHSTIAADADGSKGPSLLESRIP